MGNKWVFGFDELAAAQRVAGNWDEVRASWEAKAPTWPT